MRLNCIYFIDSNLMYQLSISHWYDCITCIYHMESMRWIKCTDFTHISWSGLKLKITNIPSSRFQSNSVDQYQIQRKLVISNIYPTLYFVKFLVKPHFKITVVYANMLVFKKRTSLIVHLHISQCVFDRKHQLLTCVFVSVNELNID